MEIQDFRESSHSSYFKEWYGKIIWKGKEIRVRLTISKECDNIEIEKYNKYAAFYNQSNSAILGDFGEYYFDTFTENKKRLKKVRRVDLLELNSMRQKLNSLDESISKIEVVINEKPEFKNIDNYIKEYIEAIKEEKKLDLEILDYYEKGVYKEDSYEGAIFLQSAYLNTSRKSNEKYGVKPKTF